MSQFFFYNFLLLVTNTFLALYLLKIFLKFNNIQVVVTYRINEILQFHSIDYFPLKKHFFTMSSHMRSQENCSEKCKYIRSYYRPVRAKIKSMNQAIVAKRYCPINLDKCTGKYIFVANEQSFMSVVTFRNKMVVIVIRHMKNSRKGLQL